MPIPSDMPRIPLNDLLRAYERDRERIDESISEVLQSGWYVQGPQHRAFEDEFARYHDVDHCIGVASGTDALELAMRALTAGSPARVVTAANAGGYSTVAALRAGLEPVYADVDPTTLCLTAESVEATLDDDVAVVVVTHLYGRMAPVEDIVAVCSRRGVLVVEDCAQAAGARRDAPAGAIGDIAAFSFYPTKNLGALGDGGAVLTRSAELAERVLALRQYGWTSKYTITRDGGRNSRLDELQAAILRIRLLRLDKSNRRRREIVAAYAAAAVGAVRVLPAVGEDHVAHLAVARVDAARRDSIRSALADRGIGTDVHYPVPDHRQPALRTRYASTALPVTEAAAAEVVSLPCFPELTDAEVEHVCQALRHV